jgi:phosphodiesterase/alkaline phosphatase D-like protein
MHSRIHVVLVLGVMLLVSGMALAQAKNAVQITKGPVVEHSDANSAVLAWSTNVAASAVVKYGTDQNNLTQSTQAPWGGLTHRVTIKNLEPGKTYYYQIQSAQAEGTGTAALGPVGTFTTRAAGSTSNTTPESSQDQFRITNGPVVENINGTSAVVAWSTDRPASSVVKYGTDPNKLDQTSQESWGATTHRVEIKNLQPNTQYYFNVQSAQGLNAPGQHAASQPISFRTTSGGQEASSKH